MKTDDPQSDLARYYRKGSHRKWTHPKYKGSVTISGQAGADAREYQEEAVAAAIAAVKGAP